MLSSTHGVETKARLAHPAARIGDVDYSDLLASAGQFFRQRDRRADVTGEGRTQDAKVMHQLKTAIFMFVPRSGDCGVDESALDFLRFARTTLKFVRWHSDIFTEYSFRHRSTTRFRQ